MVKVGVLFAGVRIIDKKIQLKRAKINKCHKIVPISNTWGWLLLRITYSWRSNHYREHKAQRYQSDILNAIINKIYISLSCVKWSLLLSLIISPSDKCRQINLQLTQKSIWHIKWKFPLCFLFLWCLRKMHSLQLSPLNQVIVTDMKDSACTFTIWNVCILILIEMSLSYGGLMIEQHSVEEAPASWRWEKEKVFLLLTLGANLLSPLQLEWFVSSRVLTWWISDKWGFGVSVVLRCTGTMFEYSPLHWQRWGWH